MSTESDRGREGNGGRRRRRKEGKKKSFCFVVADFELIFLSSMLLRLLRMHGAEFFGEVVWFTERGGFL